MLSLNNCHGCQTPKAAVLPEDTAVPWPQLQPQYIADAWTRGSEANKFYIITYQTWSQNQLSLHRHLTPDNTSIFSSLRLGFQPCHTNKEQGLFLWSWSQLAQSPWWHPYRWSFATSQNSVAILPLMGRSKAGLTPKWQGSVSWHGALW